MNIKNNRRHQETVRRIESVFLQQLQEKSLSQIRVSDICQAAQINRSTFYANYTDIYHLAETIHNRLENEVNRIFEADMGEPYNENYFLKLFQHVYDNQQLYTFYFKLGFDQDAGDLRLYNTFPIPQTEDEELLEYHMLFFTNGFNSILKRWLERGCIESPAQMCNVLLQEYRGRLISHAATNDWKP